MIFLKEKKRNVKKTRIQGGEGVRKVKMWCGGDGVTYIAAVSGNGVETVSSPALFAIVIF